MDRIEGSSDVKKNFFKPCCDIYETEGKVCLELEMPGITRENLDVKIVDDKLIIHGKRDDEHHSGTILLKERRKGDFYNEFSIDDTIDRNKIEASLSNGIALIVMGIKESEKPRKIKITAR